ncbi:uncharacterized protein BXIN_0122 [Babesia sp. Xinjiang]|uniref:uncharacterized protein n=1 Tax=Babesia sp. Xinjiang TaxID=462227 RepID=UPI000A24FEFD|nr:uncharacterized protein BXIN_0122 [Babesia sp. Xinjiang]ORM39739.1 hypothetical protein BXIN_0122 [Babesia sp. Xinjiang]
MKSLLFVLGAVVYQALICAADPNAVISITNGTFDVEIPENVIKVLSCSTGKGLTIKSAHWVATRPRVAGKAGEALRFDRTNDVTKICRGLNNCVLKPVAHLDRVGDGMYIFFGLPLNDATYKLHITGVCESTPVAPLGRKMISVIDSGQELVMGCNEGEVINVSLLRGAGLYNNLIWRHLYCTTSFMQNAFELCQNKRSCTISKKLYNNDKKCNYQVIDALYYCRPPYHHAYIDIVRHSDRRVETILTAEEDSHVVVKAPAESVLSVQSATWDVVGKVSEEDDPRRNRLDILQFYCEGRSSCTFIPKRTSNGMLDLHLGGITGDIKKPFMLRATFEFVKNNPKAKVNDVQSVECVKGGTITMTCPNNKFLRIVTALWGGAVTNPSQEASVVFWEEKKVAGKLHRVTEIGALLDKHVFNKNSYTFDPFAIVKEKQQLPFLTGVRAEDHKLSVTFTCMDKARSPSVSDIAISKIAGLTNTHDAETSLEKEKVLETSFKKDDQLIITIEQKSASSVQVGNFLTVQLPAVSAEEYRVTTPNGGLESRIFNGFCDNVILSIIFADSNMLHITTNLYNKGKLVATYVDDLVARDNINYGEKVKDVVVANGGVIGMRVFVKSTPAVPSRGGL